MHNWEVRLKEKLRLKAKREAWYAFSINKREEAAQERERKERCLSEERFACSESRKGRQNKYRIGIMNNTPILEFPNAV